ncbi:MAG: DEAD/DEAH box helicase [Planctomycetota bacterium]
MIESDELAQGEAENPFVSIPRALSAALTDRGFEELTAVQRSVADVRGEGKDLRISSRTGSGKTVALGLAIADSLLVPAEAKTGVGPRVLIVVPTRELAAQVQKEVDWLYAGVRSVQVDSVTGGTNVEFERRRLRRDPAIVVGTPGRLVDHLRNGALDLSSVEELVLDEADQMLDLGFREDLETIVQATPETVEDRRRRTHMVSATFPAAVRELAERYQRDALEVEGQGVGEAHTDIEHLVHVVRAHDRVSMMTNVLLLAGEQRVLVFVATRAATALVAERLATAGFTAQSLSGELAQSQRTSTLEAFRSGTVRVLVATDVAARGLDIPEVATVIHADLPMDAEIYTHRSGRTGRAGRKGRSILLATPNNLHRARRILHDAGVKPNVCPTPSAENVRRAQAGRLRKDLVQLVAESKPDESAVELAEALISEADPLKVVSSLVQRLREQAGPEPVDIEAPRPREDRERSFEPRDRGPRREGRRPARREDGYTQFRINWGFRHGANPKRLLAVICRRGDIQGRDVGAIDVNDFDAVFGVKEDAARHFQTNAARPDERHPQQTIEKFRGGEHGGGGRPPFGRDRDRGGDRDRDRSRPYRSAGGRFGR